MWDWLTTLLHWLAYFGVWVLNVMIYEFILLIVWLMIGGFSRYVLHYSEARTDDIIRRSFGVLLIILIGASIAYFFGWLRIIPLPVFD